MNFYEELLWILDKKGNKLNEDEIYQQNIDFVHSLGKKCDRVGWSKLTSDDDIISILNEIKKFCKTNGWTARGNYERIYTDIKSDWYELKTSSFSDASFYDTVEVKSESGKSITLKMINAYKELKSSPKDDFGICVPERFRNACLNNNIDNVKFCWVQDKGKYEAEQYFNIYPDFLIPRVACDRGLGLKNNNMQRINDLGGFLPEIASVFSDLDMDLPDCYLAEDMPEGGIAYSYYPDTDTYCGRYKILIHKDVAEILVREKALSWNKLKPVPILGTCPEGYILDKNISYDIPMQKYIDDSIKNYEILKESNRPLRVISEKDTLKVLRQSKKDRKEDFSKPLCKKLIEKLETSELKNLTPYYKIANGGNLSDEYSFLSYENTFIESIDFFNNIEKEELLNNKSEGVVIAKCADGDVVLLLSNAKIIRFSFESLEVIKEWNSVAQFFFDAINEDN